MASLNSIPTLSTQVDILEARMRELTQGVRALQDIWQVLRDEIAKQNRRIATLEAAMRDRIP